MPTLPLNDSITNRSSANKYRNPLGDIFRLDCNVESLQKLSFSRVNNVSQ